MIRGFLLASAVGLGLAGSLPASLGPTAALAQGCLSPGEARAAVQRGDAVSLSAILGQIEANGGQILPPPQLCSRGGRLVYIVNVLGRGGRVKRLVVDAASGGIQGN